MTRKASVTMQSEAAGGLTSGMEGGRALGSLLAQLPRGLRVSEVGQGARMGPADVKPCDSAVSAAGAVRIQGITDDSRAVGAGTLFVAAPGMRQDGHRFIPQAVAAGAVAVVGSHRRDWLTERGWWPRSTGVEYVQVTDSREALAWLSAAFFAFPSRAQTVIGVTGTDGKTTTCALLEAILSPSADVGVITTVGARIAGVEQATGLHVTTPDAPTVQGLLAQMRSAGCGYAVVESTSFGLDQKRVAAVEYDAAALTNITHEHLDVHGSVEAYRAAKFLLFRSLFRSERKGGRAGVAVFNLDDGSCRFLRAVLAEEAARNGAAEVIPYTYSVADRAADVYARGIEYLPYATRFELVWRGGSLRLETRLIGEFNVSNILCAAAVALGLGIPPDDIRRGVASLSAVLGRMQRMDGGQDFLAVVDFAHSPASLARALETLRALTAKDCGAGAGRLIAIFGCAGLRDRGKRRLMGQVSGRLADFTIITAEDPRTEALEVINQEIAAGVVDVVGGDRDLCDVGMGMIKGKSKGKGKGEEESGLSGRATTSVRSRFAIVPDRAEAIRVGVQMARAGDVVASFGKGHERSMCFGETEYPWNEQEAMLSALRDLRGVRGEA